MSGTVGAHAFLLVEYPGRIVSAQRAVETLSLPKSLARGRATLHLPAAPAKPICGDERPMSGLVLSVTRRGRAVIEASIAGRVASCICFRRRSPPPSTPLC